MTTSTKEPKVRRRLDRDRFVPFHLNTCANKMSRGASRLYLQRFGIGIIEWAMLSFLSIEPSSTAQQICDGMSLDKAAASRNLKSLLAGGYVAIGPDPADSRKRAIVLTDRGAALHDRVIEVALEREASLLAGFTTQERDALIGYLRRMYGNLCLLDDQPDRPTRGVASRKRKAEADEAAGQRTPDGLD